MSDSVQPHRQKPTRLPRPWDSLGKNTGVGCHFLLQCVKGKSESEVTQSCPTLSDPMDCSLPGSAIHGIFQARVLEWGAIAFSKSVVMPHPIPLELSLSHEVVPGILGPLLGRQEQRLPAVKEKKMTRGSRASAETLLTLWVSTTTNAVGWTTRTR